MIKNTNRTLMAIGFVAFEAVMHVYLALYLIAEKASVPAIIFTLFEMVMFFYLLLEPRKKKDVNEQATSEAG